jgi:ABC-type transport system involved in cytochrome bd biosynthesis fused ATPase/permease subunit
MLRDPLNVFPQAFMAYSDAKISLGHIATFLNTEEKKNESHLRQQTYQEQVKVGFESTLSIFEWKIISPEPPQQTMSLQKTKRRRADSSATPTPITQETAFKLQVPHTQFIPGKLSVISGPPQCGKTSLLAALLGDMPMISGEHPPVLPSRFLASQHRQRAFVRDSNNGSLYLHKVAYVAQKAWIEHGTIRENILFSEPWDDARYRAVLHQCDLLRDLALFDNGDLTSTTDRGIAASGKKKKKKRLGNLHIK